MPKIIADSSTLILLTKAGIMEGFLQNKTLAIPNSVYEEAIEGGKEKGREDAYVLGRFVVGQKIGVSSPRKGTTRKVQNLFNLRAGERDAIALALDSKAEYILCDDKKAINACKALKLRFTTALDVLLAMYKKDRISKEKANESPR